MSRERSSSFELNSIEDPVGRHHSARASRSQRDPSRTTQKGQSSDRAREVGLASESVHPRPPDPSEPLSTPGPINVSDNPETIPKVPEREPSPSRRSRGSSHDRSNSFPLLDNPDAPFVPPPLAPAPQTSSNYYSFATRPEPAPYIPYSYSGIRSTPQPSRQMSYNDYPGIRSAPQPSRDMPYTTYGSGIRSVPQPSRDMPSNVYDSGPQSVPLPTRQMPSNVYDSGPQSVPLPTRQRPTDMYGSGPQSVPLPPSQRAPYVLNSYPVQRPVQSFSRARRGDAFVANDPFHSNKNRVQSDTYDSFDNMPTDVMLPSAPYIPPSQPPISLPPGQSLPSQPFYVPAQPPIIPAPPSDMSSPVTPFIPLVPQAPTLPPVGPVIPPQQPMIPPPPTIIMPPPHALPSHPAVIVPPIPPSQPITLPPQMRPPTIAYPDDSGRLYESRPRPSSSEPPLRPTTPPRVPDSPVQYPESVSPSPVLPISPSPVIILPPPRQDSPISSTTSPSILSQDVPETVPPTTGRFSPVRRPEETVPSPTVTLDEAVGDPTLPIPTEYPNGYGPYFEQHGIPPNKKKFSFGSTLRNLFTWPFPHQKAKPTPYPYPYPQPPYGYASYPLASMPTPQAYHPTILIPSYAQIAGEFVTRTLPTQIYLNFLLRLPSLYFTRVARIFEEADLTLPEIKKMALETASKDMAPDDFYVFESTMDLPPQYTRLKTTWESFIDSVIREWKTFNIISVLLLSAILTILQIQTAEQDPIIRYTALSSLICALISLLFGCMYIIRFGTMRKTYKAAEWALEAKRTRTIVWWNVWVLLAMPVVWLVWSIILYIACIMTFIWRTSSQDVAPPLTMSRTTLLAIRVVLSSILGLGIIYATLIMSTFRRYGEIMDNAWKERIRGWIESKSGGYFPGQAPNTYYPQPSMYPYPPGYPPDPGSNPFYRSDPTYGQPMPMYAPGEPPSPAATRPRDYYGYDYPPDQKSPYPDVGYRAYDENGDPPPAREERRKQFRKDSETSSTSTSAYRPFFNGQETHNSLRTPPVNETNRRSSSRELEDDLSTSLPQASPMKAYLPPTDHPRGARTKRRVSVPPPTTLPTIPGTPGTSTLSYLTPLYTDSPPSMAESSLKLDDQNVATSTPDSAGIELPPQPRRDSRVQFRSPLVSVQSSQDTPRTGTQQEAVDSAKSSISGLTDISTNVPWTPFPSPISRHP